MIEYVDGSLYRHIYVIGDIHGCFNLVAKHLESIGFDKTQDLLISPGDTVDRGENSRDVLQWIGQPWFKTTLGNHEQMHIDALDPKSLWKDTSISTSRGTGGGWIDFLGYEEQMKIISTFSQLPIAIELTLDNKLIGFVHGEARLEDWSITKQLIRNGCENSLDRILWNRTKFKTRNTTPIAYVDELYVGHTIVHKRFGKLGNVNYVDHGIWLYGIVKTYKLK